MSAPSEAAAALARDALHLVHAGTHGVFWCPGRPLWGVALISGKDHPHIAISLPGIHALAMLLRPWAHRAQPVSLTDFVAAFKPLLPPHPETVFEVDRALYGTCGQACLLIQYAPGVFPWLPATPRLARSKADLTEHLLADVGGLTTETSQQVAMGAVAPPPSTMEELAHRAWQGKPPRVEELDNADDLQVIRETLLRAWANEAARCRLLQGMLGAETMPLPDFLQEGKNEVSVDHLLAAMIQKVATARKNAPPADLRSPPEQGHKPDSTLESETTTVKPVVRRQVETGPISQRPVRETDTNALVPRVRRVTEKATDEEVASAIQPRRPRASTTIVPRSFPS